MSAEVYFAQRRATQGGGLLEKLEQLFDAAGFGALVPEGGAIAVKLSFGAPGNTTSLRPQYLQRIIRKLTLAGARPFLTDTLPAHQPNGIEALLQAQQLGLPSLNAPLVVADGLFGRDETIVRVHGEHLQEARIASAIAQADAVLGVCHFTGHEATGFAGALWNMGLGAASAAGKREILAAGSEAGNGQRHAAIMERMVEYAAAAGVGRKVGYINVLVDLTPETDYLSWSDTPIVPDIGILASRDPVALDQASVDLLNQTPGLAGTRLQDPTSHDKLRDMYPALDWEVQLAYAERLGLGKRDYELMII